MHFICAWPMCRVRNRASGAYIILPTQSSHKYLWGVAFPVEVPYVLFLAGWLGLIATTHHYFGGSWKAAVVKAVSAAAYADSSSLVLWSCNTTLLFLLYFTSLSDFRKKFTAYEQEEATGKQFPLTAARTPAGRTGPSSGHCGLHSVGLSWLLWTSSWFKIRRGKLPSRLVLDLIYPSGEALDHCTADKHVKSFFCQSLFF